MARFTVKVIGLSGCLLALLCDSPGSGGPFLRHDLWQDLQGRSANSGQRAEGPKPQEVLKALPADIARGPGFRPSHEQVLAEVEERTWIVSNQLTDELAENLFSRKGQYAGADGTAVEPEITGSLQAERHRPVSPSCRRSMIGTGPWISSCGNCGARWTCRKRPRMQGFPSRSCRPRSRRATGI